MKFAIKEEVARCAEPEPRIGDVFPCKGGQWNGAKMWVLIAVKPNGTHVLLGLDYEGNIVAATHYAAHVMKGRPAIGRVEGLEELEFHVEPLP